MKGEKTVTLNVSVDAWDKNVVLSLADGLTIPEIAKETKEDPRAVEYKLSKLKSKVQCKTGASLVAFFLRNKLID